MDVQQNRENTFDFIGSIDEGQRDFSAKDFTG